MVSITFFWSQGNGQPEAFYDRTQRRFDEGHSLDEQGEEQNTGVKCCNCKSTGCLKRYCDCFKAGLYCTNACSCQNCKNNEAHAEEREKAIRLTLGRDPNAFRPKISKNLESDGKHSRGCHCKRTFCLKGYCECFQAGVPCSDLCKCTNCKNYENSPELQTVRASQHENGTLSTADPSFESDPRSVTKRPRHNLTSPSHLKGRISESYLGQARQPLGITPILQRGASASQDDFRNCRDAASLLTQQCSQLFSAAQEEIQHVLAEQSKKDKASRKELSGKERTFDNKEIAEAVESAVVEETAALLATYTEMLRSRSEPAHT
uniref:CRC domain-containing protein n=1 Tax=Rhodosorus marinus TaxID=101924 RepID=A0A7S3A7K7_9RHOD|mmetsp:Transcript_5340/g.22636  ORF Transcript_5340/g.22636 Transcript_5340/m.22636 type:complete len:320 (+) Transcript_5340:977-1936(+)